MEMALSLEDLMGNGRPWWQLSSLTHLLILTATLTERRAQRGQATSLRPSSQQGAELGSESRSFLL